MPVLVRFKINAPAIERPSFEDIANALAREGAGSGDEAPEFRVWGNPSYPDSTLVEYLRSEHLVNALDRVRAAIDHAGVARFCAGGDLNLPASPIAV
jgi:hypothetical protein